jgi:hypothetical protein
MKLLFIGTPSEIIEKNPRRWAAFCSELRHFDCLMCYSIGSHAFRAFGLRS